MILKKLITLTFFSLFTILGTITLTSCSTKSPPHNRENICAIFRQYPEWYWDATRTRKRWGIPASILMAIIYQESRFSAKAKPPRRKLLWIIPWFRPTSAYGYSQAINQTWKRYKRDTGRTSMFTKRDAFGDAADFIGWFSDQAHRRAGISKFDAYSLYLAYHEGIGGYLKGTYRRKTWLIAVSKKVKRRAEIYRAQLRVCEARLPKKPWWKVWK